MSDLDSARSKESAGRYQRSFSGMIGAMLVSLALIAGFVLFRAVNRDNQAVQPEPVDWIGSVRYIQDSGASVYYPTTQPEGWIATSADYRPGTRPLWSIGFLTPAGDFVGLHEEDRSVEDLIGELVDEHAAEGDPVRLPAGTEWRSFTDAGGDFALAREQDDETIVVFGTAEPQVIEDLAGSLTTAPLND